MAVIINRANNKYEGKLKATADVENGVFVLPDYANGTASVPPNNTEADKVVWIVDTTNFTIDQQGVGDTTFVTKNGEFLRIKRLHVGDVFTTDKFKGTYGTINVGDVFTAGSAGTVEAIGARTPAVKLVVMEKTSLYGNNALKFVVTQ